MSTLYLVRHGQASFGKANYDKLSEMGEKQSTLLGAFWVRFGVKLDAVYSGTLERQKRTAELVGEAYEAAGIPLSDLVEMPEFNEYDTAGILTGSVPEIMANHPEVKKLMLELAPDGKPDLRGSKKTFQRMFAQVMDLWVNEKIKVPGLETWRDFAARVNRGLEQVMEQSGNGVNVAVFTSGGPISAALQRALGTADKISMDQGWAIANASVSEFRFSGGRFSMMSFNTLPHLETAELITYR